VIVLDDVTAVRGDFVLEPVALAVPAGAQLALLGASGAGKTTLLEAVAGLLPARGRVCIGGRDVSREPPERRGVGLVTQDALLFPHLDVAANVGFGLPRAARAPAVEAAARLTGCTHLLARRTPALSGGERRRVALARAVARRPAALLLDEPLAGLETPVRRDIAADLRTLAGRLGAALIHVTHDLEAALATADLLGVLDAGRLIQLGPPAEVCQHPVSPAVAALVGTENVIAGEIRAEGAAGAPPFPARLRAGRIELRGLATREGPGHAALRAEDVTLAPARTASSAQNQLTGVVTDLAPSGPLVRVGLDVLGVRLVALVTRESAAALGLAPGITVYAHVKAAAVHFL